MTPEEKKQIEIQIQNDFSELQQNLENLKREVQSETDESKKQEKNKEIQRLEKELSEIKTKIDTLKSLQEEDLQLLKTRLESTKKTYQQFRGEATELQNEKSETPTTYKLLKNSETYKGLLNIISSNPDKFKNLPGENAEEKLEHIFKKIRESIVLFITNKLGNFENAKKVIDNTIAPAFERSLMELLNNPHHEGDRMFDEMDNISRNNLEELFNGVKKFANNCSFSYSKFNQRINAIDYLSVHNGVLNNPNKSKVLTNPLEFQKYMNNEVFAPKDEKGNIVAFSPYSKIDGNIFQINENQNLEFGISLKEKQDVLTKIGNIPVEKNPKITELIAKMINKPEQFLRATSGLQDTANHLLDGVDAMNSITKPFGIDILGEISKVPEERTFRYKILDFVCKLIGISGGLEGIVKNWRIHRMDLTDEKKDNIREIFKNFKESAGDNQSLTITDENSCKTALNDFAVTDPQNSSSTKGDFLRDSIAENMDVSLISPAVIQAAIDGQILGNSLDYYLKKETGVENGKTKEKVTVDESKITTDDKLKLAHKHLINMKSYLEEYNDNDLSDFYTNINSTEDIALCITASLYANKNDIIEGVKAMVFLPENYKTDIESNPNEPGDGENGNEESGGNSGGRENLDSTESADKQIVSEQWLYDKAVEYGITDERQIAYVLSTVKGECSFKNQGEIGEGKGKKYGKVDPATGHAYYGRGFIQLTWKENYQKYTQIIQSSGKEFKDNNGNPIKGKIDLVNNPNIILQSNDLAAFILMDWMKNGGPDRIETKKLSYYINDTKTDYYNARSIVNGMSSNPQGYADTAQEYSNKLGEESSDDRQQA